MIVLQNVTKGYQMGSEYLPALRGITTTIQQGSFVALVGPSGCGKSTLLNLLGGLDKPDSGSIMFDDQDVVLFKEKELERYRLNHIGTIFQSFNLISHMTAIENVEVPMTLAGMSKRERRKKAKNLLELVGLSERMNHKPNQLSGGQKQRVAIARALALNPKVILADEPTGALDTKNGQQILELLKKISHDLGTTIIMVTHSPEIAEEAEHIITMRDGTILSEQHRNHEVVAKHDNTDTLHKNMSYGTALRHAFANLFQKKWRTLLVAIGASIGICGIALMVGLGMGIEAKVTDELQTMVAQDSIEITTDADGKKQLTDEQLQKIGQFPEVKGTYQWYVFNAGFVYGNQTLSDNVFSNKPQNMLTSEDDKELIVGSYPKDDKGIVISKSSAEQLVGSGKPINDLVGKTITAVLQNASVDGNVSNSKEIKLKITGINKNGMFNMSNNLIDYNLAQKLSKQLDIKGQARSMSSQVIVKSIGDIDNVKSKIKAMGYYPKDNSDQLDKVTTYSKMAQAGLGLFAGISLVVSSIMIGIVMYISVLERTKEIGILRAIGARRKDIRRIFIAEAGAIGGLAGIIGLVVSALLALLGNEMLKMWLKENAFKAFELPLNLVLFCFVFSVILSVIAGLIPSRRASRLSPIDALRHE